MLRELSLSELADWLAYMAANPAGHVARDMQNEVMRIRFLGAWAGKGDDDLPNWRWPYTEEPPTLAEIRAAKAETRRKIEASNGAANLNGQHQNQRDQ